MAKGKLTKEDLELRKMRYAFYNKMTPWFGGALLVVFSTLPLLAIGYWVHELAGKTTNINAVISVSIAANLAFASTVVVQGRRRSKQTKTIENLRGQLSTYQEAALEARGVGRRAKKEKDK